MDPSLSQISGSVGEYTRILTDDTYFQQHASDLLPPEPTPNASISENFQTRELFVCLERNNIDEYGYDHVGADSDEDEDEHAMEANDVAIRCSAPSQIFNEVPEVNEEALHGWRTWSTNNSYNGEFCVGQEFDSLDQLKYLVKSYSISKNQVFKVVEVDSMKYVVECKRKHTHNCSWRLRAVRNHHIPSFRIVKYDGPHSPNCVGDINSLDHPMLTSEFVSHVIRELIRADPTLKIKVIVQIIKDQFHFTITY